MRRKSAVGMWTAKRSKPLVGIRVVRGFPQGRHFHSTAPGQPASRGL